MPNTSPPTVSVPLRRRGRPPLAKGQVSVPVSVRMPEAEYARLCREAKRRDMSVAELLRLAAAEDAKASAVLAEFCNLK
jgi:hypothetical protein